MKLERKSDINYTLQQDNNKLSNSLLSSAKFSSIDEVTVPSIKISSINELHKSTATTKVKTTVNHAMIILPTVEMQYLNVGQGDQQNVFNSDLTKLATVIVIAIATANPIATLRLPPVTTLDIKVFLRSVIAQLTYTTYFLPLLNSSQSFVSLSNAKLNPTVDAALCTQLTKTIPNLTMKILNPDSTSKNGVEILLLLQAKISMSKSPNDIDILYENWCNMAK